MLWEDKELRDVTEEDLLRVVRSGLAEHFQLEYKRDLYENNDRGSRESLLDICMFANAEGGLLLIGVPELRDGQGQATGMPDPGVPMGVNLDNAEATLQAFDARVTAAIEERLPLESAAIHLANGSYVLAFRIQNSAAKPHCVRYQGHVYFPSRRERSRYEMDVREIKELVMRTASRVEKSEQLLEEVLGKPLQGQSPHLHISTIPVFSKGFLIDFRKPAIRQALAAFDVHNERPDVINTVYAFDGLERRRNNLSEVIQLQRNGLIFFKSQLALRNEDGIRSFFPISIDLQMRGFVLRTRDLYRLAQLNGPFVLSMMLRNPIQLAALYPHIIPGALDQTAPLAPGKYAFPSMLVDDFGNIDDVIRPFCDHAHQTFGRGASPCFDADGHWIGHLN